MAAEAQPYTPETFSAAQNAGKSILVHITAPWCPTCRAQKPILAELTGEPQLKDLIVFDVDFDNQKNVVRAFRAQMQSTLIVFKGEKEMGRTRWTAAPSVPSARQLLSSSASTWR